SSPPETTLQDIDAESDQLLVETPDGTGGVQGVPQPMLVDEDGYVADAFLFASPRKRSRPSTPTDLPNASSSTSDEGVSVLQISEIEVLDLTTPEPANSSDLRCVRCDTTSCSEAAASLQSCACILCSPCMIDIAEAFLQQAIQNLEQSAAGIGAAVPESLSCPGCSAHISEEHLAGVVPVTFQRWSVAASEALMRESFVRCPNKDCQATIEKLPNEAPGWARTGVPEFDRTLPAITLRDEQGQLVSAEAATHHAQHRYRCSLCTSSFCGSCLVSPYHIGDTCEQHCARVDAFLCRFCQEPVLHDGEDLKQDPSVAELRCMAAEAGADTSWCMERSELNWVARDLCLRRVCRSSDCRARLAQSCTRRHLACGHACGGVREEGSCLPCLECEGAAGVSADDFCGICWVEPLRSAPAIRLQCGHVVHAECARSKVDAGYPGPAISFQFLCCPLCRGAEVAGSARQYNDAGADQPMRHPMLEKMLVPHLECRTALCRMAKQRMLVEKQHVGATDLEPGGRFEGRPGEYALGLFNFYHCSRCDNPYLGGARQCGPAAGGGDPPQAAEQDANGARARNGGEEQPYRKEDLVCGACCGAKGCERHGAQFLEYKCRFCCKIATWFCFGTTHFCDECHTTRPDLSNSWKAVPTCSAKTCPLRMAHPNHGSEFCLGCAVCNAR
ncbi:hypothetical protein CYMTET_21758, partial [Cymbomonas tetramitiformis]